MRDELPDEIDAADLAENLHGYMFMTELTWPSLFFGAWAAFEPDVSILIILLQFFPRAHAFLIHNLANYPLSMGKGSHFTHVQRRARPQKIPHRRREMYRLQIVRGNLPGICYRYRV